MRRSWKIASLATACAGMIAAAAIASDIIPYSLGQKQAPTQYCYTEVQLTPPLTVAQEGGWHSIVEQLRDSGVEVIEFDESQGFGSIPSKFFGNGSVTYRTLTHVCYSNPMPVGVVDGWGRWW